MIVVDAYSHLGECRIYEQSIAEYEIIDGLNQNRVSASVVAPFPGAPNPAQVHDNIADLARRYPGRVFGLVNVNPHIDRDRVHREAERCVRQLGFVGIVLDTFGYAVNPNGQDAQTIFEIGRELAVPIVVHTGTGVPFGLPSAVLPRAREYSDVKIVLAHAGAGLYAVEASVVAKEAANVYLETSWSRAIDVKQLIGDLGANRVMFGSDVPTSLAAELAKLRALNLYQFQQHLVLGQTAIDVFALQGVPEVPEPAAVA